MAPTSDSSTFTWALAIPPAHPLIVPPSVEKMNAEAAFEGPVRKFPGLPANTSPVGAPATPGSSPTLVPSARYSVGKSTPLPETHHGDVALASGPPALTRCRSVTAATPATFAPTRV